MNIYAPSTLTLGKALAETVNAAFMTIQSGISSDPQIDLPIWHRLVMSKRVNMQTVHRYF